MELKKRDSLDFYVLRLQQAGYKTNTEPCAKAGRVERNKEKALQKKKIRDSPCPCYEKT